MKSKAAVALQQRRLKELGEERGSHELLELLLKGMRTVKTEIDINIKINININNQTV